MSKSQTFVIVSARVEQGQWNEETNRHMLNQQPQYTTHDTWTVYATADGREYQVSTRVNEPNQESSAETRANREAEAIIGLTLKPWGNGKAIVYRHDGKTYSY